MVINTDSSSKVNQSSSKTLSEFQNDFVKIKIYKKRYLALILYCFLTFSSHLQFLQYTTIPTQVKNFYNVNSFVVNLTGTIWYVVYIPGTFLASSIFQRIGLRNTLIIGSICNTASTVLKCFSVESTRFWLTMFGQTLVGISEIFILSIPPILALTWFPKSQISKATGIGYAFTLIGVSFGSLIASFTVPNSNDITDIGNGFLKMFLFQAALSGLSLLLTLFLFENEPPYFPSEEQAIAATSKSKQLAGIVNFLFVATSIPGSIVAGLLLDCARKNSFTYFRYFIVLPLLLYTIMFIAFASSQFVKNEAYTLIIASMISLIDGTLPVISYEFGGEATNPLPQSITAAIQN
ncbi:putative MFS-type transporter C09D4.1-like isoform X1, partial [Dinothrombium tinctorium]